MIGTGRSSIDGNAGAKAGVRVASSATTLGASTGEAAATTMLSDGSIDDRASLDG
jgi:hypothetical protein